MDKICDLRAVHQKIGDDRGKVIGFGKIVDLLVFVFLVVCWFNKGGQLSERLRQMQVDVPNLCMRWRFDAPHFGIVEVLEFLQGGHTLEDFLKERSRLSRVFHPMER